MATCQAVLRNAEFRSQNEPVRLRSEGLRGYRHRLGDLRRQIPQIPAEPLNEEKVVQGVFQLQDLYEARGYFDAEVRVHVDTDSTTRQAVVIYQIGSGPRSRSVR